MRHRPYGSHPAAGQGESASCCGHRDALAVCKLQHLTAQWTCQEFYAEDYKANSGQTVDLWVEVSVASQVSSSALRRPLAIDCGTDKRCRRLQRQWWCMSLSMMLRSTARAARVSEACATGKRVLPSAPAAPQSLGRFC